MHVCGVCKSRAECTDSYSIHLFLFLCKSFVKSVSPTVPGTLRRTPVPCPITLQPPAPCIITHNRAAQKKMQLFCIHQKRIQKNCKQATAPQKRNGGNGLRCRILFFYGLTVTIEPSSRNVSVQNLTLRFWFMPPESSQSW